MNATTRKAGRIRLIAGTVLAAAAMTVAGATSALAAPAAPAGTAPVNHCTTPDLKAALGQPEGAAGSVIQKLVLTNVGQSTCTVQGFPSVAEVDAHGQQIGLSATLEGPNGGVVTLAPGYSADADVRFARAANYDPEVCNPTPVAGLIVTPAGNALPLSVPRPDTGCASHAVTLMGVQALAPQQAG